MIHHPFGYLLTSHSESSTPLIDGVNLEDDDVRKEGEEAEKGVRKESAATKKSREMIEFAERQTIENVVLNRDKSDVETLGGTAWLSLSVKAKTAFLRKIKVMIPQNKSKGEKQLMKELLDERGRVKKQERTYTKEYERLKEELGYESAECSPASVPASLPSDDDISV
jgi:hypothetical protein